MARVTNAPASKKRKNKRLKMAKGYWGGRSKLYRTATEAVNRALAYATRDNKAKKRTFRSLWITRINAGARAEKISYSKLMEGLKKSKIDLNRKILAYLALEKPQVFKEVVKIAKGE